jgi:hypothetical protein
MIIYETAANPTQTPTQTPTLEAPSREDVQPNVSLALSRRDFEGKSTRGSGPARSSALLPLRLMF